MKIPVILVVLHLIVCTSFAQQIQFKNRKHTITEIERNASWDIQKTLLPKYKGDFYGIIQFAKNISNAEKKLLQDAGIILQDYIPGNAFTVRIPGSVNPVLLNTANIIAIIPIPADVKVSDNLWRNNPPGYAVKTSGTVAVLISINKTVALPDAVFELQKFNAQFLKIDLENYQLLAVRIPQTKIKDIAALAFVNYIQPLPPADKKLNDDVRASHKANFLQAPVTAGGENLQGRGVVIGIGDNANLNSHIDLADRVIDRAPFLDENHGVHVAGTAAGGGLLNPSFKGVAPLATLLAQVFGGIYKNAAAYVADFGMVITNNSYGAITGDCSYAGVYDLYSSILDQQAFQFPDLLHVFAAGNDGPNNLQCAYNGYHTLLGGYQSSKNILAVGWGDKDRTVSIAGSWGPSNDGRTKPEIIAAGSEVRSTGANNTYVTDWGSSMSAPAVSGGAALLVEKYRQMYAGANPKSGLVKAWLMNGADDIDKPGPDYKSGFGWMNLQRSAEMVKNNRFVTASVSNGNFNQHTIAVPAGMSHLKVMLYWHDPAAAVFAATTLVNDLDIELVDPSNNITLPWKLDSAQVTAVATRGADKLNNVEQVTITNPPAGNYIVRVKGTAVNVNPSQEYYVVYDYMPPVLQLTYPSTTEPLLPGEGNWINWNAYDLSTNDFTLEFSSDNGATYAVVNSAIPGHFRNFYYTLPGVTTAQAKFRITRNGTANSSESSPFVLINPPGVAVSANQCKTYFTIQWPPVPGATDYEVFIKRGPEMVAITTTTNTSFTVNGLSADSTYLMSASARINGRSGRRGEAVSRKPNTGNCSGNISDNDLIIDSIISPNTGRKFTSTEIVSTNLVVRIQNLDDASQTNFDIKYSINGGAFVTETVMATIPALGTYTHTFTGLNFSAAGTYNIVAVVKKAGDPVAANDTARKDVQHLPNPKLNGHTENFETAPAFEVVGNKLGLPGLPQWDLITTTPYGRARSFVNSGFAFNGNRALTLDVNRFIQTGNTNYLIGTFNLSDLYFAFPDQVSLSLDFWYKNHGQQTSPDNRVWARSADTLPWVEVFNLDSAQSSFPGEWKYSGVIYIWKYIGRPTSSTQIRIGQRSVIGTSDNENFQGFTIDSLRIFQNRDDFGIVRIDAPLQKGCALGGAETLTITTTSSRGLPTSIPVKYRLNGGPIVTESFFTGTGTYSFNTKLDLSAPGEHTIDVWIDYNQDFIKSNDSIRNYKIQNQPLISTFPYLQNFESNAGSWYSEGRKSTWQLGTPSSLKINKAASGNKAWKTTLQGTYNDDEFSYLYSPCFNTSSLATPYLSFAMAMDMEQCTQSVCDAAWMEYSLDGKTWQKLGAYGQGSNWYNRPGNNVWDSAGFKRWHSASIPLPNAAKIQLRFVIQTDGSLIKEGIALDDIHIYDRQFPIYSNFAFNTFSAPVVQNVIGNGFINFTLNGSVIASVNSNGNNLGNTIVQAYKNVGGGFTGVRSINNQYYHDRNITVKPTEVTQPDSTTIRFYFTDAETDTLVRATGCSTCTKPVDAYTMGITKYDDNDDSKENGTLADNTMGIYTFINKNKVLMVPYDNGYYAEFKVKNFSEFWLNNGGMDNNSALPLQLQNFVVTKQGSDVLVKWNTINEVNIDRYEVEVAKGNEAYSAGRFEKFFTVNAFNRRQNIYETLDAEAGKKGVRYYRLKMIDKDGLIRYSEVKLVLFATKEQWAAYPNPVTNVLNIVTQAEAGTKIEMQMMNVTGQIVWQRSSTASGLLEKNQVDLNQYKIPAGVYVLKLTAGEVKYLKVIKQ